MNVGDLRAARTGHALGLRERAVELAAGRVELTGREHGVALVDARGARALADRDPRELLCRSRALSQRVGLGPICAQADDQRRRPQRAPELPILARAQLARAHDRAGRRLRGPQPRATSASPRPRDRVRDRVRPQPATTTRSRANARLAAAAGARRAAPPGADAERAAPPARRRLAPHRTRESPRGAARSWRARAGSRAGERFDLKLSLRAATAHRTLRSRLRTATRRGDEVGACSSTPRGSAGRCWAEVELQAPRHLPSDH